MELIKLLKIFFIQTSRSEPQLGHEKKSEAKKEFLQLNFRLNIFYKQKLLSGLSLYIIEIIKIGILSCA